MRKVAPVLVAGLLVGFAVTATMALTALGGLRRTTVLTCITIALAAPIALALRRTFGTAAGVAVWLAVAPLAEASRRVMGRAVEVFRIQQSNGQWSDVRPAEWRIDAPFVHGLWRFPPAVVIAWGVVACVVAAVVVLLHERLRKPIVALAWVVSVLSLVLTCATLLREARRTSPMTWARALPELPRPSQLDAALVGCTVDSHDTFHGVDFDVEREGCTLRLWRKGAVSPRFMMPEAAQLQVRHDAVLDLDVLLTPSTASVLLVPEQTPKTPPVVRVPHVHRVLALCTTTVALALLAWPRRRRAPVAMETAPYRASEAEDTLRDESTWLRASAALSIALLGVAPLLAWLFV